LHGARKSGSPDSRIDSAELGQALVRMPGEEAQAHQLPHLSMSLSACFRPGNAPLNRRR
jgi:hypothetical protein